MDLLELLEIATFFKQDKGFLRPKPCSWGFQVGNINVWGATCHLHGMPNSNLFKLLAMLNVSVQIGQKNKLMTKEILRIMLYEIVVLHRTIGRWLCSLDKVTYINNFGKSKDTPLQHNIANGDKNIGRGTNNNLRIK